MGHIGDMLDTLVEMTPPDDTDWEVIVVDNGSSDDTFDIASSYSKTLPLKVVKEPQAGLSFARNKGIETAAGEYIIWTDDDVRVDKDWLCAYNRAFKDHPDAAYFGGVIEPVFLGETPDWLTENIENLRSEFAQRDLGSEQRVFKGIDGDTPYGANFAVRGQEQRKYLYPTYLGVSPNFQRVGEETFVLAKITENNGHGYWIPDAKVLHIIPEARQSLAYILKYNRSQGETWAVLAARREPNFMNAQLSSSDTYFQNAPLWLWRKAAIATVRYLLRYFIKSYPKKFKAIAEYGYHRGALDYLRKNRNSLN